MSENAVLRVEGLVKSYGALKVTDDVSMTLRRGEIHAVIGPNGAGKTSLVRQITGEVMPDRGRIMLAGRDVTHEPVHVRARLGLARTFQITRLLPAFTVHENVAVGLLPQHGSAMRFLRPVARDVALAQEADAVLARVGMAERAGVPVGELSHGEHRKLELALALAQKPAAFLLDEPLAGTGPEEVEPLIALLRTAREVAPILIIDHDMHAVFSLADRVTVLVAGRVLASGSPAAIRADPAVLEAYLGDEMLEESADA